MEAATKDKVIIITGATNGIGKPTAINLAKDLHHQLIILGRSEEKGAELKEEILKKTKNDKVVFIQVNLESIKQVKQAVDRIKQLTSKVDVLINNAGLLSSGKELTEDGIERTFAVNHIAPFVLTNSLLDLLKKSSQGRIVNVASDAHRYVTSPPDWTNNLGTGLLSKWKAYSRSKLANIEFTIELARKLEGTSVTVNSLHPGVIRSNLFSNNKLLEWTIHYLIFPFTKSIEQGAETTIYLATSPDVEKISGKYFVDCKPVNPKPVSRDIENQRSLWKVSAAYLG